MELSTQDIEQFRQRGYSVQAGFYDQATIQKISAWLDALKTTPPPDGAEACYYELSPATGEELLVRVEHVLGDHNPEITRLMLTPKLLGAMTDLLGEEPVLFKEKVNYKLPGTRPDKLHQDQAAGWNVYTDFFVTMAVVIDANRRDNAALSFLANGKYEKALMGPEWHRSRMPIRRGNRPATMNCWKRIPATWCSSTPMCRTARPPTRATRPAAIST